MEHGLETEQLRRLLRTLRADRGANHAPKTGLVMSDGLAIWLYGEEVARIERTRNRRLRLTYSASALRTYELGTPVLSLSLPVSPRPFPNEVTTSFLDGLLPEGDALRAIAEDLDLRATDTYSLISALGRDCAGCTRDPT